MKLRRNRGGFTLVEIITAAAIIVVLAAVGVPAWLQSMQRGQGVTCANNLRIWLAARDAYYLDNPQGPATGTTSAQFMVMLKTYLPAGVEPNCPAGGTHVISPTRSVLPGCSYNGTKKEADLPDPLDANGYHDMAR